MNIGEVGERTGLPAKTIRYYEEIGLVHPRRGVNGYRAFSERDLHRLAFVGRARALGFAIEDCRVLLALYDDPGRPSAEVKRVAQDHLARIDRKISELAAMRATLAELVEACHGDSRPDCPILRDLSAAEPAAEQGG
jgi:MerR family copper efflux transcriptional regulator